MFLKREKNREFYGLSKFSRTRISLEHWVPFWAAQYETDMELLDSLVKEHKGEVTGALGHGEERLSELGLFSPKKRRLRYLINIYKYLKGGCKDDGAKLLLLVPTARTRGNGHKMEGSI